jgi:hypothetical protein
MSRWFARTTVFAIFFAVTCFVLAWYGKLTSQYVAAISAVHAFVVTRAVVEDLKELKQTPKP